jgi:hypothetical protein
MSVEVRIYNPDLELQGIIDEFSSLVWIRRYQEAGEFELHTPYSDESRRLLMPENIVQRFDGMPAVDAGVIESLSMTSDEIIVKGRFLESYLARRIVLTKIKPNNDYAEDVIRSLLADDLFSEIPLLELGPRHGWTERITFQASFKNVHNTYHKICKATGLGFRIYPDFETRKLYLEVLKGADKVNGSGSKVIFSETYDNLMNEEYTYDSTNYKTEIYATQIINNVKYGTWVGTVVGLNRRDMVIQTSIDPANLTDDEIHAMMALQCERALESHIIAESFTFSTDADAPFRYRTDYDLGDLVLVKKNAWGIELQARLTEIEEDYENGGREVILRCGSPLPEVMDFEED